MGHQWPWSCRLEASGQWGLGEWRSGVLLGLTYRAQGLSTAVSSLKVCSKLYRLTTSSFSVSISMQPR